MVYLKSLHVTDVGGGGSEKEKKGQGKESSEKSFKMRKSLNIKENNHQKQELKLNLLSLTDLVCMLTSDI